MAKQSPNKLLSVIAILIIVLVAYFQRPATKAVPPQNVDDQNTRRSETQRDTHSDRQTTSHDDSQNSKQSNRPDASQSDELLRAIDQRLSNVQVQGQGTVDRILPDDNQGSRHQRFILRLDSGQTVLVTHNIDLASKISQLRRGDLVEFAGEFEWNSQGGVIHWTHLDPRGRHPDGYLKHQGKIYK